MSEEDDIIAEIAKNNFNAIRKRMDAMEAKVDEIDRLRRARHRMKKEDWKNIEAKLKRDEQFRQKKQAERAEIMAETKILYYAGIGSRETPEYILKLMEQLACKLREDAMTLRTGHASGADQAFERGAGGAAQIFLPWRTFNQDDEFSVSRSLDESGKPILGDDGYYKVVNPTIYNEPTALAFETAAEYHSNWGGLKQGAQKLHARNVHQILGPDLARPTPVEFVICWTKDGSASGGTGQALRIANDIEIPVYNLHDEEVYDFAFEWAWGDGGEM